MSHRVVADVYDFGPDDPVDCSVLVCLASHCNDDGKSCFPSIGRIARMVRRSERTVTRCISSLEKCDWITVRRGSGKGNVSSYEINVDRLKRCQRDTLLASEKVTAKTAKGDSLSRKGDSHDISTIGTVINRQLTFRAGRGSWNKPPAPNPGSENQREPTETERRAIWESMSANYRKENPYVDSRAN